MCARNFLGHWLHIGKCHENSMGRFIIWVVYTIHVNSGLRTGFTYFGDLPKSYPIFPMVPSLRKSCRGILLGHWRHIGMLTKPQDTAVLYTVPKEINFSRYDMKCSGENVILRGIFLVVSCSPLHFMLSRNHYHYHYRGKITFRTVYK